MRVKISSPKGEATLLAPRELAGTAPFPPISEGFEAQPGTIRRASSMDEQPYICANFNASGQFVGGRALTAHQFAATMEKARMAGLKIETEDKL